MVFLRYQLLTSSALNYFMEVSWVISLIRNMFECGRETSKEPSSDSRLMYPYVTYIWVGKTLALYLFQGAGETKVVYRALVD